MRLCRPFLLIPLLLPLPLLPAQERADAPLPNIPDLVHEVQEHQRQLDKVRESYTYSAVQVTQDIDSSGQVKKTETEERDDFFVNGHVIERIVQKNGQPLSGRDEQKETERVSRMVEKAEKTPPGQPLDGTGITVSRLLQIMDVRNPRREMYRGRPAIVFDFVGRKDAKTHGLAEDASKKLKGTVWIDEADRQVAHLEVSFDDNFRIAGGLFASIAKGSSFRFDQAPVQDGLWLPTGGEGTVQARLLLLKNVRQRFTERDFDYKRFKVQTQQSKDTRLLPAGTQ
jgi:hypothetical protein